MNEFMGLILTIGTFIGILVTTIVLSLSGRSSIADPVTAENTRLNQQLEANNSLLVNGILAEATVVSSDETGRTINYAPIIRIVLDVDRASGAAYRPEQQTYRVETQALLPVLKLARVQPGCRLPVRVDPRDPSKVAVDLR